MQCPRCGADLLELDAETFHCLMCGFDLQQSVTAQPPADRAAAVIQPITPKPITPVEIDLPPTIYLTNVERLNERTIMRVEGRCQEAVIALDRGNREAARHALRTAAELAPLAENIWLFMAAIAPTVEEQRDLLEHVLARNPAHSLAIEALVKLDGRLNRVEQVTAKPLEAGQVAAQRLVCPHCGGNLGYDIGQKEVQCRFCGQRILDADEMDRAGLQTALQVGLLRHKVQAQAWKIGQRWLRCGECGAITTLSQRTLTSTCRFCDSRHVLQESVNQRFEQPEFIIPMGIDERQAHALVQAKLKAGLRRIATFFLDAVERIELQGVYLPFWVFDAEMTVSWSWTRARDHGQHPILLGNVLHFAGKQLDHDLLRHIEPFDMARNVTYDPRLLATFPAELYQIDVDRASFDVRPRLTELAEKRAHPSLSARRPRGGQMNAWGNQTDNDPGYLRMNASTRYMSYQLGLFPVWIGRLIETDGDMRQVVVNGQTGEVALGWAAKRAR